MSQASTRQLAVIAGGGGALGQALAIELVRRGPWHIVVADVDLPSAQATVALVQEAGGQGEAAALDVVDPVAWQDLLKTLRSRWPGVDLLVNAAGVCAAGELVGGSIDVWQHVLNVNYYGVLHGCHAVIPAMKQRGSGAVLNVASITGLVSMPSMGAYASSKAAVVALSEALYAELLPTGVSVTVAAPGFFPSALIARGDFADEQLRDMAEELTQQSTLTAEAAARAALDAVGRRQLFAVGSRRSRRLWRLKRLAPAWLTRRIASRYHERRDDG